MKVRTRMVVAFLFISVLGFSFLFYFVEQKVKPVYLKPMEDDLVDLSHLLAAQITQDSLDGKIDLSNFKKNMAVALDNPVKATIYEQRKNTLDLEVYVTDKKGMVIYDSLGKNLGKDYSGWRDVARTLKGRYGARSTWYRSEDPIRFVLYVAAPIIVDDQILGVVSVGKDTPQAFALYETMQWETWFGIGLAILLACAWGILFTAWITRPIRALTEYVQDLRDGKKAQPPRLAKSDIGTLGVAFEEMRDALEGKQYVEQYVQTLTHEIKSPLSAIRGASELLHEDMPADRRARFLQNIHTETARIQKIVDRLLELSTIETRKGLKDPATFEMSEVIKEVIDHVRPQAEARKVNIEMALETCPVNGERFLIQLALSNVISNALEFSPEEGTVQIQLTSKTLEISDEGPGIPDYALPRVFERFYSLQRPDTGRKSSGLGLSIVKTIADLHHFRVGVSNRPEGGALVRWEL